MKIVKIFIKILLWIIGVFLFILAVQYLFAPVYNFQDPRPFSGNNLYNPYQDLDSNHWRKSNFQVQSRAWAGVTDGSENTNEMIDSVFRFLGYDVIGISDYMHINKYGKEKDSWIPIYEHGYSIRKHHHVCIGAEKVVWHDYALFQSLHHKQHMIDRLRPHTEVVIMAHPRFMGAFDPEDFTWLRNFDGIEILNYFRISIAHWDSALSAGNYVIGIGNDDVHDIMNPDEVGQFLTLVNSESLHGDSIINAMKHHKTIAVEIFRYLGDSWEIRKQKHDNLEQFREARLYGDTLRVKFDRPAEAIRFVGQSGKVRKITEEQSEANYIFQPEDTYIRTEIEFPTGNTFYLNPVIRTPDTTPETPDLPDRNLLYTWIYRLLVAASIAFVVFNIVYLRKRFKKRRKR